MEELKIGSGARPSGEANEEEVAGHVRDIFDAIAPSYDTLNHLLSMGLDHHWWARAARRFRPILARPETCVLDLCCGTGDMTAALMKLRPHGAEAVTGLDFSSEMLDRARSKYAAANANWVEGDAMHLPYANDAFDLVTAAFGFRNLSNYAEGLREIARVLRPGGQIGILECNQPDGLRGFGYGLYFRHVLPKVGGMISGQRAAYEYLPASVARFPRPPQMLAMLADAGFRDVAWDGYLLRAAGLYHATRS